MKNLKELLTEAALRGINSQTTSDSYDEEENLDVEVWNQAKAEKIAERVMEENNGEVKNETF